MRYMFLIVSLFFLSCSDTVPTRQGAPDASVCTAMSLPCIPNRPWGDLREYILVDNWTDEERERYVTGRCTLGVTACLGPDACGLEEEDCPERWHVACVGYQGPLAEQCSDNIDGDCDGEQNNGFDLDGDGDLSFLESSAAGDPCGQDCDDNDPDIHTGAAEVCDGKDNDCDCWFSENRDTNGDGIECGCSPDAGCDENVDERPDGQPIGTIGHCVPSFPEGIIENVNLVDWGKDSPCEMGQATCIKGKILCEGGIAPGRELCNGVDDNCNGSIDEPNNLNSINTPCGSDIGACLPGYLLCSPAINDMVCVDYTGPQPEDVCNGINDDCDLDEDGDELVDENAVPMLCTNGCPTFGYQYCVDGEYTPCDGPLPTDEEAEPCNAFDDDCDGQVDEGQECQCDPAEVGPFAPDCSPDEMLAVGLTCGTAKKDCVCENGECNYGDCYLACDPWVDGIPRDVMYGACPAERCDAWDWNCWDGPIDGLAEVPCDCDPNSPIPEIAALARQGNGCEIGACTAGSQACLLDEETNTYQMLPADCNARGPAREVCDELDNDCDTLIDEDLRSFDKVDMVFVVDITGSMREEIEAVSEAIIAYAADFALTEHRFALVLFPAPYSPSWAQAGSPTPTCGDRFNGGHPHWNITSGLVGVNDFLAALNMVLAIGLECGDEPSYDVLFDITSRADPIGIGWRADAYPYVFFLGDEEAQSWRNITENQVAGQSEVCDGIGMCPCGPPDCPQPSNQFEIHCFVSRMNQPDYDTICYNDVEGDSVYDINIITAQVLRNIFADVCLPSAPED